MRHAAHARANDIDVPPPLVAATLLLLRAGLQPGAPSHTHALCTLTPAWWPGLARTLPAAAWAMVRATAVLEIVKKTTGGKVRT